MPWRVSLVSLTALALAGCAGQAPPPRGARAPVADLPVKIGRPYAVAGRTYVPADERDYDEVGIASWYGDEQSGVTANGERQDVRAIAGAHRTLPLPSYVEVTALATGRTITVRINDRGPFVAGRIVDLSPAAARQLGMRQDGVARVRVRRVYPLESERAALREGRALPPRMNASPQLLAALNDRLDRGQPRIPAPRAARAATSAGSAMAGGAVPRSYVSGVEPQDSSPSMDAVSTPAPMPTPAGPAWVSPAPVVTVDLPPSSPAAIASPVPATSYFIQVGAFADPVRAAALAARVGGSIAASGAMRRVRVGPFASEAEAGGALAKLRAEGYGDARMVRDTHAPAPSVP